MDHTEENIRKKVRQLKSFYSSLYSMGIACIICILLWMFLGHSGAFWPKWVILGCAIYAGVQAFKLGLVPVAHEYMPFLKPEWEDEQVKKMIATEQVKPQSPNAKNTTTARKISVSTSKATVVNPEPTTKASSPKKTTSTKATTNKQASSVSKTTNSRTTKKAKVKLTDTKKVATKPSAKSSKAKAKMAITGGESN